MRLLAYAWLGGALLVLGACRESDGAGKGGSGGPAPPAAVSAPGLMVLPPDSPQLRQIRVESVKTAAMPLEEVISPGKIEVNPNRVSRVVLPVPGRIARVMVRLGDSVTQGQTLLAIESPDADTAHSAYLQAEAAVTQARSNLVKSQTDFDRSTDLFEHNAVAKKEVLSAENALAQAKAAVEQAQALREQALRRVTLLGLKPGEFGQSVLVRAALSGKVLEINVAAGEYRNDTNAPLMTVADLSTVWVSSDVPESYIRFIQVGERFDISLFAYPGEVFRARVMRLADTVDPQTRTVKVLAEMENRGERFRPEMYGSIRHTESVETLPVLPPGAVIEGDGRNIVLVEQAPGRFEPREVTLGKRAGNLVAILKGLKPGERVVVDGAMLLRPNDSPASRPAAPAQ